MTLSVSFQYSKRVANYLSGVPVEFLVGFSGGISVVDSSGLSGVLVSSLSRLLKLKCFLTNFSEELLTVVK